MATRPLLLGLVVVSVALAAGCSPDKPKKLATSSPAVLPSATPSLGVTDAAGRDALAAYRGMWATFVEAGKTSDPEAPDLPRYASDQALKLIVSSLYTDHQLRRVSKGEPKIDPRVTVLKPTDAPTEATITDCVDDKEWLRYKESGGLVDNVPGGKHRTTATVKRTADGWKVASFILKEKGTC